MKKNWTPIDPLTNKPMKRCPRCDRLTLRPTEVYNALSRRGDIYICSDCGIEEGMIDYVGHTVPVELGAREMKFKHLLAQKGLLKK